MLSFARVAALVVAISATPAFAEMNGTLRIGVLNDMSSVYADFQGAGSVLAAQMAAEDFAKTSKRKIEILSGDHQNKPDIGANIARQWIETEGVNVILDIPNSAVGLAVREVTRTHDAVDINTGAASSDLTGKACSPPGRRCRSSSARHAASRPCR